MEMKYRPETDHCYILNFLYHYRPQRSLGQGCIFTGVCDSVHRGGSASVHAGIPHPPSRQPPRTSHPPRTRHPPDQAPPPPRSSRAYLEIRSTSGRYTSYWNAILYFPNFALTDLRGSGCNFMQFLGKFDKTVCWHPPPPPFGELVPPARENPGSTTVLCEKVACDHPSLNEGSVFPHIEGEGVLKYYFTGCALTLVRLSMTSGSRPRTSDT